MWPKHRPDLRSVLGALLIASACGRASTHTPRPSATPLPIEVFIRTRCATDGRDVFAAWHGSVHADIPGQPAKHLFDVVGMNVSRCGADAAGWYFTSRELMYYLDPKTGAVLHRWHNPWTGETVPVMHVANSPVQSRLPANLPAIVTETWTIYQLDYAVRYPNPLANHPARARYGPAPFYIAREIFSLRAATNDVRGPNARPRAPLKFEWRRYGPWLPWMAMGGRAGRLRYRAKGRKLRSFAELPAPLRREITGRMGRYRHAPPCFRKHPRQTSWTYFVAHVAAYRRGERFPVPERHEHVVCTATQKKSPALQ